MNISSHPRHSPSPQQPASPETPPFQHCAFVGRRLVAMVAIISVGATGCSSAPPTASAAKPAGGAPPPTSVGIATVEQREIQTVTDLPGRVRAYRTADIRPQVSGIIKSRLFKEGSIVEAGQVLYEIDPRRYEADHRLATAQVRKARAALGSLVSLNKRYAELVKSGAISKQEVDNARTNLRAARAEVSVARANVAQAKVNLDYTKVVSPITGHIGTTSVTEGALVTSGQAAPLATVRQLDPVYIDLTQSSEEAVRLRTRLDAGKIEGVVRSEVPVAITINGIGGTYAHDGRLDVAGMTVDEDTGAIQLRAVVPNPDTLLLPGLFVRARVTHSGNTTALVVPQAAVQRDQQGNASVWLVGPDETVNRVPIEVGVAWKDHWVVKSGLSAGQRVVVEGTQRLRPGASVAPQPVAR